MDYKRYILIGAAAVLSYMLLIEWGQFTETNKRSSPAPTVATSSQAPNQQTTQTDNVDDTRDLPSDLPTETALHAATPETQSPAKSGPLITVTTDTLKMSINRNGGDIVAVSLPKYYAHLDTPDQPFKLLEDGSERTYIAQSGLIGRDGIDRADGRPVYQSTADHYEMAKGSNSLTVDLVTQDKDISIIKRFTFHRDDYLVDVDYIINNQSDADWSAGLFAQIKRDHSADPSASSSGFGLHPYLGAAVTTAEEPFKKIKFDDMQEKPFKQTLEGGWIAMLQHYFLSAWIANPETTYHYSTAVTRNDEYIIRFTSPAITIAPGKSAEIDAKFYAGPKDQYELKKISPGLDLSVDYGWLWWIAQPLFLILTQLHKFLGNWGFAIIAVTVLVKAAFFWLNAKAYTSMANMRKVQPKLLEIRERYADDKAKQSQEMMSLYKKEKINPLGGCLPILIQMPVFISLYWVLMESVELRHSPFVFWIKDLSVMDPYFILPLIMGVSMFIQQKLNPPPPDPMQAKVMQWMPVMFTFFFLFFPAGLVLYWVVNNTLSIVQQYIITKRIEAAG